MSNSAPRRSWTPRKQGGYRPQQPFTSSPGPTAPAKKIKVTGDPHLWTTLQKIVDETTGNSCHTRAMQLPTGLLINTRTTTSHGTAEALAFLPGVALGACAAGVKIVAAT